MCTCVVILTAKSTIAGFRKRGLLERGSYQKSPFLKILENSEILENPQTVENKGGSDHFLEILF